MKNLKINRKIIAAFGLATAIVLAGCGKHKETEVDYNEKKHKHLYVTVGDEVIVFKECEGYKIQIYGVDYEGFIIKDLDGNVIISGRTNSYLEFYDITDKDINEVEKAIQENNNVKVYKLENNN